MGNHHCRYEDGIDGIATALAAASPGDTVVFAPGRYETGETLTIPSGVALSGYDAILIHDGQGPAVQARQASDVALLGLTILSKSCKAPRRITPDGPTHSDDEIEILPEWGVVWFEYVTSGHIKDLRLDHERIDIFRNGVAARCSTSVSICSCTVTGAGWLGIVFLSVEQGSIEACAVWASRSHGVWLATSAERPETGSDARITGNRLHDNGQSGLILFSSESGEISGNDIWGNGSPGIALQRSPYSPDAPSTARITGNRLHDNGQSGLVLLSSESGDISGNEIWGNGIYGIALQRGPESPDAPSTARITGNRLHDNGQSGLVLDSSESGEISGNDIWGNGIHGIALLRASNSPEAPSTARITGNRLHDNGQSGLSLFSSESGEISGNDIWGNGSSGITLQRAPDSPEAPSTARIGMNRLVRNDTAICAEEAHTRVEFFEPIVAIGNRLPSVWAGFAPPHHLELSDRPLAPDWLVAPDDFGSVEDWTSKRDRESRVNAPWAALTEAIEPVSDADGLGAFLSGGACPCCLRRWFAAKPDRNEQGAQGSSDTAASDGTRYQCGASDGPPRLQFHQKASIDTVNRYWNLAQDLSMFGRVRMARLALIDADDTVVDEVVCQIRCVRDFLSGRTGLDDRLPETARAAVRSEAVAQMGLAAPLTVDHRARSLDAYQGLAADTELFEDALLEGRSKAREQAVILFTSWRWLMQAAAAIGLLVLVTAGVGFAKGYVGAPWRLDMATLHALVDLRNDYSLLDVFGIAGTAVGFLGLTCAMANANLPPALRIRILDLTSFRWLRLECKADRDGDGGRRGVDWQRWIRRRFYNNGLATIIVRNASEWSDDDAADLRAALNERYDNVPAIVILTTTSRELADRGLLAPFAETAEDGTRVSGLDKLELLIENDERPLTFECAPDGAPDMDELLGLARISAGRDLRPVQLDRWSPTTVLPMLTLGSSAQLNFSLFRNADPSSEFVTAFVETLRPYAELFNGEDDFTPNAEGDRGAYQIMLNAAYDSAGILVTRAGRDGRLRLTGGSGTGQLFVQALLRAFPDQEADCRFYVARLKACGARYGLREAQRALEGSPPTGAALRCASLALGGAEQMLREMAAIAELDDVREQMLKQDLDALSAVIEQTLAPVDTAGRLEAVRFYAVAIRLGIAPAGDIDSHSADNAVETLADCFRQRIADAFRLFEIADAGHALKYTLAILRTEGRALGDDIERLESEARARHAAGKSLAERLEAAANRFALYRVVARHRALGVELVETLYLVLARAADSHDRQLRAARIMAAHRAAGVTCQPRQTINPPPCGAPRGALAAGWDVFAGILESARMTEFLAEVSACSPLQPEADLPDVQLGYFAHLRQDVDDLHMDGEELVEMIFGKISVEPGTAPQTIAGSSASDAGAAETTTDHPSVF